MANLKKSDIKGLTGKQIQNYLNEFLKRFCSDFLKEYFNLDTNCRHYPIYFNTLNSVKRVFHKFYDVISVDAIDYNFCLTVSPDVDNNNIKDIKKFNKIKGELTPP